MKISATKAAKMAGVTTPTITRAIENGDISAEKKPRGGYLIDVSEIDRFKANRKTISNDMPENLQTNTPNNYSALQVEIEGLRERLSDKDSVIDDLRTRLDKSEEERRATQARLEDHRDKAEIKAAERGRKWFWQK